MKEPMNFLIANTFSDSLARLVAQEQKVVKITAFDLQMNPANPGMQFHRMSAGVRLAIQHHWVFCV
jgi:hypothetical protein